MCLANIDFTEPRKGGVFRLFFYNNSIATVLFCGERMIYDRPTKTLMKEFADEALQKGQLFSKSEVVEWFKRKYPNIKTSTVEMNVEILAVNNVSIRRNHKGVRPGFGRDLFYKIGPGQFRLWEEGNDPEPFYPDVGSYSEMDTTTEEDDDQYEEAMILMNNDANPLPKNVIFYGPPGSGKTYNTINRALEILDISFYKENKGNRAALVNRFNKLKEQKRIGFVTFHQSFTYEEFVEGLKADNDESGQLVYRIEPGIFKTMSADASSKVVISSDADIDLTGKRVWKVSLGRAMGEDAYIYEECIENNYILIGYGENLDFSRCSSRKEIEELLKQKKPALESDYPVTAIYTLQQAMQKGDIVIVTDGNLKFRAIGKITGDYRFLEREDGAPYTQCRDVEWLKVYAPSRPKEELTDKTFSQMTIYELKPRTVDPQRLLSLLSEASMLRKPFSVGEKISKYLITKVGGELLSLKKPNGSEISFPWDMLHTLAGLVESKQITVEDIRQKNVFTKVNTDLEKYIVNGYDNILAPIVEKMVSKKPFSAETVCPTNARVLIIDEINRGNIAKIFGELITLIEPDKRFGEGEGLSVELPYSKEAFSVPDNLYIIGTMNTADRSLTSIDAALRRRFEFKEFCPEPHLLGEIKNEEGIEIKKVMEEMNKRIELLLGREYLIGHSYFLALAEDASLAKIGDLFRSKIIPLLQEYFFDDWEKIHRVLGDHQKPEKSQIVRNRFDESEVSALLGEDWQGVKESCWTISEDALCEPDAYIGIYQTIK